MSPMCGGIVHWALLPPCFRLTPNQSHSRSTARAPRPVSGHTGPLNHSFGLHEPPNDSQKSLEGSSSFQTEQNHLERDFWLLLWAIQRLMLCTTWGRPLGPPKEALQYITTQHRGRGGSQCWDDDQAPCKPCFSDGQPSFQTPLALHEANDLFYT